MDALNHILQAVRLQPQLFKRHALPAQFSARNRAGYHLVEQGACWLYGNDGASALKLETGDLVVVCNTRHYHLSEQGPNASASRATLVSGEFRPDYDGVMPIFSLLPPCIHIHNHQGQPIYWLATALRGIASEAEGGRPGYEAVVSRLVDILFIMVMRSWIDQHPQGGGGWLGALYDAQVGKALNAIHAHPDSLWTVDSLAQVAGLSRSYFSERFTQLVGEAPMKYLTRWRIQLATTWLCDDASLTVEQVAYRVGYTSSFAFSKAFKRLTGSAPMLYRKQH